MGKECELRGEVGRNEVRIGFWDGSRCCDVEEKRIMRSLGEERFRNG